MQGSQAWNSIFRPGSIFRKGYTDSPRNRSYVIMNSVLYHLHPVKVKRHAVKVSYTLCLGGLSFFLFILLTVTGIFLMFFYRPTAAQAWNDIYTLQTSVTFGLLVRNMHRWAAHLMVLSVFLHMARVFYHGAYKPPREFNWVIGVILLTLTLLLVVHRLPAAVGPAGALGGHRGHEHDGLHAGVREPGALRAARRRRDRHRHAAALVRAARADAPVRHRHLHGHPLLAGPQGRRHLRAAVGRGGQRMTEIPEHLRKRAEEARKKAAAAPSSGGRARRAGRGRSGGDAPQSEAAARIPAHLLERAKKAREQGRRRRGRRRHGHRARHRSRPPRPPPRWPPPARPSRPGPVGTPSACSPSSSPARSRTSRPCRRTRSTSGRTCSSVEFVAALLCTAFLLVFSIFVNAPLLALANINQTPNPSKAPWYFLGLQELLTMFHPMVAGVTIPGMGIFVLILAPYIDRNPCNKPEDRKFAISLMTVFLMFWAVLVMIGSFFRGPGSTSSSPGATASSSSCRRTRR